MNDFKPPKYHAVAVNGEGHYLDHDYFSEREKVDDFCLFCQQRFPDFSKVYVYVVIGYCYAEDVRTMKPS